MRGGGRRGGGERDRLLRCECSPLPLSPLCEPRARSYLVRWLVLVLATPCLFNIPTFLQRTSLQKRLWVAELQR